MIDPINQIFIRSRIPVGNKKTKTYRWLFQSSRIKSERGFYFGYEAFSIGAFPQIHSDVISGERDPTQIPRISQGSLEKSRVEMPKVEARGSKKYRPKRVRPTVLFGARLLDSCLAESGFRSRGTFLYRRLPIFRTRRTRIAVFIFQNWMLDRSSFDDSM